MRAVRSTPGIASPPRHSSLMRAPTSDSIRAVSLFIHTPAMIFISVHSRRRRWPHTTQQQVTMGHGDGARKGQAGKATHVHGGKYVNREGFKAHRNMKRAVRDVDREDALKGRACVGICRRCVQKVRRLPCDSLTPSMRVTRVNGANY